MSHRLQVLLDDAEIREIRRIAKRERMTVAEWVRRALRDARRQVSSGSPGRKQQALERALAHAYPTADIDEMLQEIEHGYPDR